MFKFINDIAIKLNVSEDLIRIGVVFLFNILLSYFFRFIKNYSIRIIYSFIIGIVFLVFMLEHWSFYVIITAIIPYFILTYAVKKNQLIASLVISFAFLLFIHVYRILFDYQSWKLDCSTMQMVMTTRIVYFGLYKQTHANTKEGFFEYLGYVFFFPSCLIGPSLSFDIYMRFIKLQGQYKNIKYSAYSVFYYILKGIGHSILVIVLSPIFPSDWAVNSTYFLQSNLFVKIILMTIVGTTYRVKFYAGWGFTQAAVNISGISFDKEGQFNQTICGSEKFEVYSNPKVKTQYWNSSVQKWLRICIYEPFSKRFHKNSSLPTLITFIISALWHGVYLSYYLAFIQWALLTNITKFFYKASHKFKTFDNNLVFNFLTWFGGHFLLNYMGTIIVILDWNKGIKFYNSLYWLGTIFLVVTHLFFSITKWGQKSANKHKEVTDTKKDTTSIQKNQ